MTQSEFNKTGPLNINGNIAENFENFKEEILIYFIATETDKKSQKIQVAGLKNLLGSSKTVLLKPQKHLESCESSETVPIQYSKDFR